MLYVNLKYSSDDTSILTRNSYWIEWYFRWFGNAVSTQKWCRNVTSSLSKTLLKDTLSGGTSEFSHTSDSTSKCIRHSCWWLVSSHAGQPNKQALIMPTSSLSCGFHSWAGGRCILRRGAHCRITQYCTPVLLLFYRSHALLGLKRMEFWSNGLQKNLSWQKVLRYFRDLGPASNSANRRELIDL
jgi:hypothetical protein